MFELSLCMIVKNEEEVLERILTCAIKFADEGGDLNIRVNKRTKYICVEVENTGSEIKKEDLERVFNKFFQTDTSHTKEGNGIGLSIVHKVTTANGYNVTGENTEDGVIFKIVYPQHKLKQLKKQKTRLSDETIKDAKFASKEK